MRAWFTCSLFVLVASTASAQQAMSPENAPRPKTAPAPTLAPTGAPAPSAADAVKIAEVLAFEKAMEDAAVRGDVAALERGLSPDFLFTHGDGWIDGGAPIKVDTKATWLETVAKRPTPYIYRELDHVQVELHGDVALTIGRYLYLPRPSAPRPTTNHLYVWFERVYMKQNGQWTFLSHRTTKGPVREDDDPKTTSMK